MGSLLWQLTLSSPSANSCGPQRSAHRAFGPLTAELTSSIKAAINVTVLHALAFQGSVDQPLSHDQPRA